MDRNNLCKKVDILQLWMEDMVKKCFQNGLDQTWLCDYGGWREEFEENDICETGDNPSEGKQRRKEGGSWRGQEQVLPQHEYKYTNTQILIHEHKKTQIQIQ